MSRVHAVDIRRFVRDVLNPEIEFRAVMPVYTRTVVAFTEDGVLTGVYPSYRIWKAVREPGEEPYFIYDPDGLVRRKRLKYSLRMASEEEVSMLEEDIPESVVKKKMKEESIREVWDQGRLLVPVPRLKSVEKLRDVDWNDVVENIVAPGGIEIDPRLKIVRYATLLRGLNQKVNPHSIIVLPAQTGKSEWYQNVGILEDRVSAVSLIGTATADEIRPGTLDGVDVPICIDQMEEQGQYLIFRYLLSFMESGEARVDMAATPFIVRGNSTIVIAANPLGDPKSDFANLLRHMSRNPALGRRFGIILYDENAKRVGKRERSLAEIMGPYLELFRAVEEYARPEIMKIIRNNEVWRWVNQKNEEWISQAIQVLRPLEEENEDLYRFLMEYIANGNTHMRGAALYMSIADHLLDIALREYSVENILSRAEEYLSEILDMVFQSMKNIVQSYEERMEDVTRRMFDTMPNYMKEIISAVELYRRYLHENNVEVDVPHTIPLRNIDYVPGSNYTHFSQVIKDAAKGNPARHNEKLRAYFGFELVRENGDITAVIYDMSQMPYITPIGKFGKIVKDLEDFSGDSSVDGGGENA